MASPRQQRLIEVEASDFLRDFEKRGFYIRHNLTNHPLFSLPRLIELSKALPEKDFEYNAGHVPISLDPNETPRTGLSVEETIRRIDECASWMVMKNVEQVPEYKALLDDCLDEIQELSESIVPGMTRREGFIFVSSPGSVTPYHLDPEHNFLLQIRGTKTMYQFDRNDRTIITDQEFEKTFTGSRNLIFKDEYQQRAQEFVLTPGMGLHVPLTTPHWVKNGNEVSISFSITFRSKVSIRREGIFKMNAALRKTGLAPSPVGQLPIADLLKYASFRALSTMKQVARGNIKSGRNYS